MTMPSPAWFTPIPTGHGGQRLSDGELNSHRVRAVVNRLADVCQSSGGGQVTLFSNLCLSLARGLDFAISNDDKPDCASRLPFLVKLVCLHQKDFARLPAMMVLLFSLKNGCKKGWFSSVESEELLALVDQVSRSFSTSRDQVADQRSVVSFVSLILSRFCPRLKLGNIFVSLEVKAGFGAYVVDFLISKCTPRNGNEKIKLLVAMKDDIDTSSCLVSPNKVNFLLNGRSVDGRTNLTVDQGPQPPTVVEPILKYGTNLLQVVGQFDGDCVILVAFMSSMTISELPTPLDYVQPACTVPDSDDLTEGQSRISLLCPISLVRIKTPAKGHMCKHHQCFDLTYYVHINMKRPSWRCPHCDQAVCYTDIRIDQKMLKILLEVDENVVEVFLSADGSWKAVHSTNDQNSNLDGKNSIAVQEGAEHRQKPSGLSSRHCEIYDITEGDDEIMYVHEPVDSKPIIQPEPCKMLKDSVSVAPNDEQDYFHHVQLNPSNVNQQSLAGDNLHIHRSQHSQSIVSADYGVRKLGAIPGNVSTVPNAIQALPAQLPSSSSNATSHPSAGNYAGNRQAVSTRTSLPLQSNGFGNVSTSDLLQQSYRESLLRQRLSSQVGTTPVQVPHPGFQDSSSLRDLYRVNPSMPSMVSPPEMPSSRSCPPHLRSSQGFGSQIQPMVSTGALADHQPMIVSQQPLHLGSSAQQLTSTPLQSNFVPVQMPRTRASEHGPGSVGGVQSVSRTEDLLDVQAELNWRSGIGRMRGSLTGRAFSNALDQTVILPTHMGGLNSPSSGRPSPSQRQNTGAFHLPSEGTGGR